MLVQYLSALDDGNEFVTNFTQNGVELLPAEGDSTVWTLGMEISRYGELGAPKPVEDAILTVAENRVEYDRGILTEWYVNQPTGVKQGFTLRGAPTRLATGSLVLEFLLSGTLYPRLAGGGQAIHFVDDRGSTILEYAGLYVLDANDRPLPARLIVQAGGFSIVVDAAGAPFPITVDPLVQKTELRTVELVPSDDKAADEFGSAVAIDGNFIAISSPKDDGLAVGSNSPGSSGSVYMFARSGGASSDWTLEQKIIARVPLNTADQAVGDLFGEAIALSGDSLIVGVRFKTNTFTNAGAAYIYRRTEGGGACGDLWCIEQKITPTSVTTGTNPDGGPGDGWFFGFFVDIDADTAVVSAHLEDVDVDDSGTITPGTEEEFGAAYVTRVETGDVLIFDNYTWHGSYGGGEDRRLITMGYFAAPHTPEQEEAVRQQGEAENRAREVFPLLQRDEYWVSNPDNSPVRQAWIDTMRKFAQIGA